MTRLILLTAFVTFASSVFGADSPPSVSASEAIRIAEDSLAHRNLGKDLYILSVTLQRDSILSRNSFWFVKWSHSIPASNPKNREVGIKVKMDGTATILVKEPGAP